MEPVNQPKIHLYEGMEEDDDRDNVEFVWHPNTPEGSGTALSIWAVQHKTSASEEEDGDPLSLSIVYLNRTQARQLFNWLGAQLHKPVG